MNEDQPQGEVILALTAIVLILLLFASIWYGFLQSLHR